MCPRSQVMVHRSRESKKSVSSLAVLHTAHSSSRSRHKLIASVGPERSTQPASPGATRSPVRRNPRGARKISAQATRLEAVDDTVDPLGPLGDKPNESLAPVSEQAPTPPQKEPFAGRGARPTSATSQTSSAAGLGDSVHLEEDGAGFRGPPPVQPPAEGDGTKRQFQPSISVEEAAKPTFEITVGDPHKVGDLTSSHIVYQVRTKVKLPLYISAHTWGAKTLILGTDNVEGVPTIRIYRQPQIP